MDSCIALLRGEPPDADVLAVLGGPHAGIITRDEVNDYWLRVWGARGLLWAWDDRAYDALLGALGDEAWRVREMAAKVVARHLIGDAAAAVARLQDDEVPRVRAAGSRAVMRLTQARA